MHDGTRRSAGHLPAAIAILVAFATAAFAFAACTTGGPGAPTPVLRPLAAGEILGHVDRASASTPTAGVRTLLSVTCTGGRLVVRTNVDSITAPDDCTQVIPQPTLDGLLGLPAIITYTGDQLIIENVARGVKLSLNARNAKIGGIDASP